MKRFALRFAAVAGVLAFFPTPFDVIPGISDAIDAGMEQAWSVPLGVAAKLFGQTLPPPDFTGSGDGLREWLRLFSVFSIALLVGLAWAFDRKRTNDDVVQDVLSDYLRLNLVIAMFTYGFIKLRVGQMPPLDAYRLDTTYAESTPMGLLWRFMGFSPAYERFAGASEALGGFFLLTRRTRTLGALLTAAVMSQVVMLNLCFDVPVKLYSTVLLVTALFLLLPDARRVLDFLLLGRAVRAADTTPRYFTGPKLRWVRMLPFALFGGLVAYVNFVVEDRVWPPPNPFNGAYTVVDQQAGPRLLSVAVSGPMLRLRPAEGPALWSAAELDGGVFTLKSKKDPQFHGALSMEATDGGALHLTGNWGEAPYDVTVKKLDPTKTTLMGRGFHWVQERPINQ